MKQVLFLLVLFLCTIADGSAQAQQWPAKPTRNTPVCSHVHTTAVGLAAQQSAVVRRPYDVLSYSLDIDWTGPLSTTATTSAARRFPAVNTMLIKIDSAGVQAIELDSRTSIIDRVTINGEEVSVQDPADGILTIPLAKAPAIGEELTVQIHYTYMGITDMGFHLYGKGPAVFERIAYTLGAPDYARYWMPCNDNAYDKARIDFHVKVPPAYTVACNGLPDSITTAPGDTNKIHHWSDSTPTSTYLMVIHASIYHHFSDVYRRPNGVDTVPLLYYVWEDDYDGPGYHAKEKFAPVPDMIAWFSSHYGEYPFSKYGMAVANPFTYFAMENQTMTTLVRDAVNDEPTIAHELSHQWLGDLVSPATWNDVWMNEGGATFSEALWAEKVSGTTGYRQKLAEKRSAYMSGNISGTQQPACYRELDKDPVGGNIYNYAVTYAKGAWVYHMLRQLLGDEVFFPMLQEFLATHAYGTAETADMLASFTQYLAARSIEPAIPLTTFFDQWVYKRGHPMYRTEVVLGEQSDSVTVTVTLSQTQSTQPVFTTPIDIDFIGADQQHALRTFLNTERVQTETVRLPFIPTRAVVNPEEKILAITEQAIVTEVGKTSEPESDISIFPNPSSDGNVHFLLSNPAPSHVVAEIFTTPGERVATLYDGTMEAGSKTLSWETAAVPSGVYIAYIRIGTRSFIRKISVTR
jgi:aminopeptidase N